MSAPGSVPASAPKSLSAQAILESPDYFPLRFEGANLLFVKMSRQSYHESIFTLPNRIVTDGNAAWRIPLAELVRLVTQERSNSSSSKATEPSIIFQIAHCGSTLLSRALDVPATSMVIRESFVLRQLAAAPFTADPREQEVRARALSVIWYLLSRCYSENEPVILKANVPVNFSITEIMKAAPNTRGILLYSDFEDYLLSILKSDERRQWAVHVVRELASQINALDSFSHLALDRLNGAQAAAVLWYSQMHNMHLAQKNFSGLQSLNSKHLYQQPAATISASAKYFSLNLTDEQVKDIVQGQLFTEHAKMPGNTYSTKQRALDLQKLQQKHANEILESLDWCKNNIPNSDYSLGRALKI